MAPTNMELVQMRVAELEAELASVRNDANFNADQLAATKWALDQSDEDREWLRSLVDALVAALDLRPAR